MPDVQDLATAYYSAARAEIVQRLSLREQILTFAVTTYGVLGGFVLSGHVTDTTLLRNLFPLLSFAFTIVFFRHHILSPALGLGQGMPGSDMPVHWDFWLLKGGKHTERRRHNLRRILLIELAAAGLLIWMPGLTSGFWAMNRCSFSFLMDLTAMFIALMFFLVEAYWLLFRFQ